ncbi:MAG: NADP(H)-dependent aldo-keto reductase [Gammaproteobacteria bacterium]
MEHRTLGNTGLEVSLICLGTMTWGQQNTEDEAHSQMDLAVERGINFMDTAELYAVPAKAETQGLTERYIGTWLKKTGRRDDIVLATKVAGPGPGWVDHIRGGPRLNRDHIQRALEASLKRLRTDHVDLYQVHWPERETNYFGKLGYTHDPKQDGTAIEETLEALSELVDQGKVKHIGLSNETPWGVARYLHLAEQKGWPRVVSIQNPYSLLNRTFEVGLAEFAHREHTGLLAYSPLAFGVLSGKYLDGQGAPRDRLNLFPKFDRYSNEQAVAATRAYVELARQHGLDAARMALAYVNSRPFLTSNIIGATTLDQLESNIASASLVLSEDVLAGIEAIHTRHPNPSP